MSSKHFFAVIAAAGWLSAVSATSLLADEPAGTSFPIGAPAQAQAPASASASQPVCAAGNTLQVYWKDGIRMDSCDKQFRFKLGGRIFFDGTIWDDNDDIEAALFVLDDDDYRLRDGVEFRTARLYVSGEIYDTVVFKGEYDFANDEGADFKDVYIGVQGLFIEGSQILVGHTKVPFSLEENTSNRFMTFMERGLPNVFAPGREVGLHVSTPVAGNRLHVGFAVTQTADDDQASHEGNEVNFTGRLAGAAYADGDERILHLGAAYSYAMLEDDEAGYAQKPELHDSPNFVDTGTFDADDAHTIGVEAAGVYGPFSVQAEYMRNFVDSDVADDPSLWGYYVYGSYFLTGEHRNYKLGEAKFDRVKVKRNFLAEGNGPGAWELAVRYSHLDLSDGDVDGGILDDITVGVNWYLNPNTRVMFNYIHADLDDVDDTNAFIMRTQVDF